MGIRGVRDVQGGVWYVMGCRDSTLTWNAYQEDDCAPHCGWWVRRGLEEVLVGVRGGRKNWFYLS